MTVEKMETFTLADLAQILELFKRIPGRTCTASAFLDWMAMSGENLCVPVIKDGGAIVGFTTATPPSVLEPKVGYLPFSSVQPGVPVSVVRKGLQIAEDWLKEQGATLYRFQSVRGPRALQRVYGMTPSREVLYEKAL